MDFKQIFRGIKHGDEYVFQKVFNAIKPMIINKIISTLQERPICHTGRPITTDFNKFLDALFFVSESPWVSSLPRAPNGHIVFCRHLTCFGT